jgi:methionine biosynthesis protein MetW
MGVSEIYGRSDYAIISELVEPGSRVLDLGCGEGLLLSWLKENKNVDARGVELSSSNVQKAISKGVSVYQGDLETALEDYPDNAFDYVILSQTLQETRYPLRVLTSMLRIGKHAIVAFPNFAHWRMRMNHLFGGRAPKTSLFPHEWYDSPNIHFVTVLDFEHLAREQRWRIERRIFLARGKQVSTLRNLFSEVAVYEFTAK